MGNHISREDHDNEGRWQSRTSRPTNDTTAESSPNPKPYPELPPISEPQKRAMALKDLGNEHFKAGKYVEAESLYSQAISHSPSNPQLFSNRALTRIRLNDHNGAELDSRKAIELYGPGSPQAMKSYYFLAQAQLSLYHPQDALRSAKIAYGMCLEQKGRDMDAMSQFILRTKQEMWKRNEATRLRAASETLREVEELLEEKRDRDIKALNAKFQNQEIGETGRDEEGADIQREAAERLQIVREAFGNGREELKERVIPDYLLDPISFEVMHDPVMTPAGTSYDRVSILKHLKVSDVDPVTREPLSEKLLRPNFALKEVCSAFLEKNGWAVDY